MAAEIWVVIEYIIKIGAMGVVPENRRPASSSAWLLLILFLPLVGLPMYLLLGSARIQGKRYRRQSELTSIVSALSTALPDVPPGIKADERLLGIVRMNRHLTGMPCMPGTVQGIYDDTRSFIAALVQAIDAAHHSVNIEFYIVHDDPITEPLFAALERAHKRGVRVALLLDHLGSRRYKAWKKLLKRLNSAGYHWHLMMPLGFKHDQRGRPDLRNHRKLAVIDDGVGFIGSHNLIDPFYETNLHGPGREWKDLSVQLGGAIVAELAGVFAMDWYAETGKIFVGARAQAVNDKDIAQVETAGLNALAAELVNTSAEWEKELADGVVNAMQIVPSGPGYSTEPNLRMFTSLIHNARRRVTITSPYFVPDESLLAAMTSAAYRGVDVQLFVGASGDNFLVRHAQRSYYAALLDAGVRIFLYPSPTVLHAKYMTVDNEVGVIGSSNMDSRSFLLNYELMLLCFGGDLDDKLRANDAKYRSLSHELTSQEWAREPRHRRWVDNACRLAAAVL